MSKKDSKRVALIPGSFDPMTLGHLDLITRTAGLFDEVVVAVLENSSKKPWFSAKGRVLMAQRELITLRNVRVVRFAGLLVDLAGREGADVVVVSTAVETVAGYGADFAANAGNIEVQVTGAASATIDWTCEVRATVN